MRSLLCLFKVTQQVMFALPSESEPSSVPDFTPWKGNAEVLQRKHSSFLRGAFCSSFPQRSKNHCQGTVRQVRGKPPALATKAELALENFCCSERAASLCCSSSATGAWGFLSQGIRSLFPSVWLLAPPSADSSNKGSVLNSCANTAQVAATFPGSHTEQMTPEQSS